jgi:hypothetical protein
MGVISPTLGSEGKQKQILAVQRAILVEIVRQAKNKSE